MPAASETGSLSIALISTIGVCLIGVDYDALPQSTILIADNTADDHGLPVCTVWRNAATSDWCISKTIEDRLATFTGTSNDRLRRKCDCGGNGKKCDDCSAHMYSDA